MGSGDLIPPKSSSDEGALAVARGIIGGLPVIGSLAAEMFGLMVRPPIEKRMERWQEEVGERILQLEKNGIRRDQLQNNDTFVSTVLRASIIATHTHEKMKLSALKNAINNVGQGQAPEDAVVEMFLGFVDSLTELHLRVLALFRENVPFPVPGDTHTGSAVEHHIPELKGKRELCFQISRDLYSRGLFESDFNSSSTTNEAHAKRTTAFGDAFLRFISES